MEGLGNEVQVLGADMDAGTTNSGKIYRAGDQVRVILDRVLALERKLQFAIIEQPLPAALKKAGKQAGKTKLPLPKKSKTFKPPKEATRPAGKRKFAKKGRRRKEPD